VVGEDRSHRTLPHTHTERERERERETETDTETRRERESREGRAWRRALQGASEDSQKRVRVRLGGEAGPYLFLLCQSQDLAAVTFPPSFRRARDAGRRGVGGCGGVGACGSAATLARTPSFRPPPRALERGSVYRERGSVYRGTGSSGRGRSISILVQRRRGEHKRKTRRSMFVQRRRGQHKRKPRTSRSSASASRGNTRGSIRGWTRGRSHAREERRRGRACTCNTCNIQHLTIFSLV